MIKIDIFSGFLGAGKTTLIKKLISEAFAGERLVVIENEFGDIGIDGGFLSEAGIQITEMNSGCICCSLVGDFGKALAEVIETYSPERILIEPSGVGKLSDVIKAVNDLGLENIILNSATAVVDAKKCKMYMKNFGEFFNNQIESAGTVVLSHTKGLSEEKLQRTLELIRAHNERAQIVTADWDELTGAQILSAMEGTDTLADAIKALESEELCPECGGHHHHHHHEHGEDCDCGCHDHEHHDHDHHEHHEHDHHEGHEHHHHDHEHHHHDHGEECTCGCHDHDGHHHHHHADEVFASWGFETPKSYTKDEIADILDALEDAGKYGFVLRAKGMVPDKDGGFIYFDYVPDEKNIRNGSPEVTGKICVIGSKISEDNLKALFGV